MPDFSPAISCAGGDFVLLIGEDADDRGGDAVSQLPNQQNETRQRGRELYHLKSSYWQK